MPEHAKPSIVMCTNCAEVTSLPRDGGYPALWDKGWRWIGSTRVFSCPACPPVVIVGPDGKHYKPKPTQEPMEECPDIQEGHPDAGVSLEQESA